MHAQGQAFLIRKAVWNKQVIDVLFVQTCMGWSSALERVWAGWRKIQAIQQQPHPQQVIAMMYYICLKLQCNSSKGLWRLIGGSREDSAHLASNGAPAMAENS